MSETARLGRGRYLWPILFGVIGLLLALQAMRLQLAERAVRDGKGAAAFATRPQNGWGAALHANALFSAGKTQEARSVSISALNSTPYAVTAARTLARTYEKERSIARAEPVWQVASLLGWRDRPTQLWAMLRALSNRQADIFAMRADALLRTVGDKDPMTSVVRQSMIVPEVRGPFIERLAARPPWRQSFFSSPQGLQGKELAGTAVALLALKGSGAEPSRGELADTTEGLIAAGRYAEAQELDRTFIVRRPDNGSVLDDGGFELQAINYTRDVTAFDWTITHPTVVLDRSSGRQSMAATTEGARGRPSLTRHVQLAPGNYLFRYQTQGSEASPQHIGFVVTCANSERAFGQSSAAPLASDQWQMREFRFAVPPGCPLTRIVLRTTASDQSVEALIDDVVIRKL